MDKTSQEAQGLALERHTAVAGILRVLVRVGSDNRGKALGRELAYQLVRRLPLAPEPGRCRGLPSSKGSDNKDNGTDSRGSMDTAMELVQDPVCQGQRPYQPEPAIERH